jgi:hypothetical protein
MQVDNVAGQQPAVVERLAAQVLAWQRELPPGPLDATAGRNDYPWPGRPSPPAPEATAKAKKKKKAE